MGDDGGIYEGRSREKRREKERKRERSCQEVFGSIEAFSVLVSWMRKEKRNGWHGGTIEARR